MVSSANTFLDQGVLQPSQGEEPPLVLLVEPNRASHRRGWSLDPFRTNEWPAV